MLPSSPTVPTDSSKEMQGMDRNPQEPEGDEATSDDQSLRRQLRLRATKSEANLSSRSHHHGDSSAKATSRKASPHTQKLRGAASPRSKVEGVKTEHQGKAKHESGSKGSVDATSTQYTGYGMVVDARDAQGRWCEAKIIGLDAPKKHVFVHYVGWNARYDTWVMVSFLAAHGSHTGDVDKTTDSWNGKASLFAPASATKVKKNEAAFHKRKTVRSSSGSHSSNSHKKKSLASPRVAAGTKRRARESPAGEKEEIQEQVKREDDDGAEEDASDEPAPIVKRAKRSVNSAVKVEVKAEVVSPNVNSKEKKEAKQMKSQCKTKLNESSKVHPVRVVVATTDAISERRSHRNWKQQNVDMELDMDIQCDESPRFSSSEADGNGEEEEEEAEEEEEEEEEKPSRGKRKPASRASKTSTRQSPRTKAVDVNSSKCTPTSSSRSSKQSSSSSSSSSGKATKHEMKKKRTSAKDHPLPATSTISRSASSSVDPASALATKEKLAAIFRLRLHQKQTSGGSTPARSMQEELMYAASSSSSPASPAVSTEMDPESVYARELAAREVYIHYQNAQHLQQYYYQQALLASESVRMREAAEGTGSSDGEAAHELQGGIMDPRIIHARMSALETQRQQLQQQQLQQYYQQQQQQQALLSRQHNLQTFASTQAFLEDSGRAWQEQTKQSQKQATSDEGQQEQRQPEAVAASDENEIEPSKTLPEKAQINATASASPGVFEVAAVPDASSESNESDASSKEKEVDSRSVAALESTSKVGDDQANVENSSKSSTSACACATATQSDDGGVLYEFVL